MATAERSPDAASPGKRARDLVRASAFAALSSLDAGDGWPYGSLVMTACDSDGSPLILISRLAVHTKNIDADNKVALLFDHTRGLEGRLAGPRASIMGRAEKTDDGLLRTRFCARHAAAADLLQLDFAIYRIAVERGHLVGG
ncbi:MAG: pyridoxamine 5'-phosphate oxidase family protein, partial [Rhodospirillales bacterium]